MCKLKPRHSPLHFSHPKALYTLPALQAMSTQSTPSYATAGTTLYASAHEPPSLASLVVYIFNWIIGTFKRRSHSLARGERSPLLPRNQGPDEENGLTNVHSNNPLKHVWKLFTRRVNKTLAPVKRYRLGATLTSNLCYLLLPFIPLGMLSGYLDWGTKLTFWLNFAGIIPLAALLSHATEELCMDKAIGTTVGGLINATFGNAADQALTLVFRRRRLLNNSSE